MAENKAMVKTGPALWIFAAAAVFLSGCGYTTKNVIAEEIRTIYVEPIKNAINIGDEITEKGNFRVYRPGLEVDLTNAVINRFIFDGNLKVTSQEKANAVLTAKLTDYHREPLRYTDGDDIQEYRIGITADVAIYKKADHKLLWHELITGDTTYFLSGSRALTEDEAAAKAVEDTARRVVEKTMELW